MWALRQIDDWPVEFAAAGVVDAEGRVSTHGDATRAVPLASVTKPVVALALLVAAEEGVVDLDEPAGPSEATVRHLLAHASGLPFEGAVPIARPGSRRIYSNEAFRVLAERLSQASSMPFAEYVREAVVAPLGLRLDPTGDPASGMSGSLDDVLALGRELLVPRLVAEETRDELVTVQFPGLPGVLPDHGRFDPLDWGLGVQLNTRPPSWMGTRTSARTCGHFGGSGTFMWADPDAQAVCAALTTRRFGEWAKEAWPRFADAVLDEI